jgi:hypothetical protein
MNYNNILEENTQQFNLYLMQFEALCHFNLITYLIDIFKMDTEKPRYGCSAGRNAYVAMGFWSDASVFLYESIKYFRIISKEGGKVFTEHESYADLEVVRNNIHTYFKNGGYAKKADAIIKDKLKEYKHQIYFTF